MLIGDTNVCVEILEMTWFFLCMFHMLRELQMLLHVVQGYLFHYIRAELDRTCSLFVDFIARREMGDLKCIYEDHMITRALRK